MATAKTAMTPDVQTAWRGIVAKAWSDEQFKQKLVDNPNRTLGDAGVTIPAGVHFVIVENHSRAKVSPEDLARSVRHIARHADEVEKFLTGDDVN